MKKIWCFQMLNFYALRIVIEIHLKITNAYTIINWLFIFRFLYLNNKLLCKWMTSTEPCRKHLKKIIAMSVQLNQAQQTHFLPNINASETMFYFFLIQQGAKWKTCAGYIKQGSTVSMVYGMASMCLFCATRARCGKFLFC